MRHLQSGSIALGLSLVVGSLQGCDDGRSSLEVHRTAEFQKAAMNSRDAMMEHMKSQRKKAAKGLTRAR